MPRRPRMRARRKQQANAPMPDESGANSFPSPLLTNANPTKVQAGYRGERFVQRFLFSAPEKRFPTSTALQRRGRELAVTAHGAHVDRFHAGRANGREPQIGVFVSAAETRLDADASGGFEKNIRGGFLVFHHFARHDGVKELPD